MINGRYTYYKQSIFIWFRENKGQFMLNKRLILPVLLSVIGFPTQAGKIVQGGNDPYRPLLGSSSAPPLNLLVLERDYKLWMAAYNDASALEEDGPIDVGYKGNKKRDGTEGSAKGDFRIDYYGLFDSYKCYTHDGNTFVPVAATNNKKCRNQWSGDYLNYLTTSRMDALAKVFFGGVRYIDDANRTVLQRAYVPSNSNTWGSEYESVARDGYNIQDYTPLSLPAVGRRHLFTNVTPTNGSGGVNTAPKIKYLLSRQERIWEWVAKEVPVSGDTIDRSAYGGGDSENVGSQISSLNVYVEVCKSGLLEENCSQYGKTSFKPIGLLQQYGEADLMRFGLFTGSYDKNDRGGVIRKNIGKFEDEINKADGTFNYSTNGIIATLSKLRVDGWRNDSYGGANWVYNPVAEMLQESMNYYAGNSANGNFTGDGAGRNLNWSLGKVGSWPSGLPEPSWTNPLATDKCSKPYITLISDVNPSRDGDNLTGTIGGKSFDANSIGGNLWAKEFGGAAKVVTADNVGGITQPIARTISNFNSINALPDEPGLAGTYKSVMVAAFGRNNPIIPSNPELRVGTYALALSSPFPKIELDMGTPVVITPFGKTVGGVGNKIVGFFIDKAFNAPGFPRNTTPGTNLDAGQGNGGLPIYRVRVSFSDNDQGSGDDDMDAIVQYTVFKKNTNTFSVNVDSVFAAGGATQHLGYVISGAGTADRAYLVVRDCDTANGLGQSDEPGQLCNRSSRQRSWSNSSDPVIALDSPDPGSGYPKRVGSLDKRLSLNSKRDFVVDSTGAGNTLKDLKNPLWYVAKYGGAVLPDAAARPDAVPPSYFFVANPLKMKEQLSKVFSELQQGTVSSAQVGGGGVRTSDSGQVFYRASYTAQNWSGELAALSQSKTDTTLGTEIWNTTKKQIPFAERKIITFNPSNKKGVAFEWSKLSKEQQDNLHLDGTGHTDGKGEKRLAYLRGDNAEEGTSVTKFRPRQPLLGGVSNHLGDIIESSPSLVGAPDPKYRASDAGHTTFANNNVNRRGVVYVGANDGALHGIDNGTGDLSDGGKEVIAYIPSYVYGKLSELTSQTYKHAYYLNGKVSINDAYLDSSNKWSTIAAVGAGFGGKGISALDVTNPGDFNEGNAAKLALWDFSAENGDVDMGYVTGDPLILKTNDGKFRVITGNGYNSQNGKAYLYLINVSDPTDVVKIAAGTDGTPTDPNGLSAPSYADLNVLTSNGTGDGTVDVVYAGDLYGNLWRFDLRGTTPSAWKAASSVQRLFTTGTSDGKRQPIASAPAVAAHPVKEAGKGLLTANGDSTTTLGGVIVLFGTGKFLGDCDKNYTCPNEASMNRFYGVWDDGSSAPVDQSKLLKREYKYYTDTTAKDKLKDSATASSLTEADYQQIVKNGYVYIESKCGTKECKIDWASQRGWYMDLVDRVNIASGARIAGEPRVLDGNAVVFDVMNAQAATDSCSVTGSNTTIVARVDDGGSKGVRTFKTKVNGKDVPLPNAGYSVNESLPRGSQTFSSVVRRGLGDNNDGGARYTVGAPSKRKQNCTPTGCIDISSGIRLERSTWRELIQ
ncbi:pilus assembly protein [Chitinimonas sp. PSY-7]|uniref:PilC/PilY family type IV pilus protein n=1 Tax=Chitinimonas sp. PSY-7 TaxID=3459088 RepID=UPI004040319E